MPLHCPSSANLGNIWGDPGLLSCQDSVSASLVESQGLQSSTSGILSAAGATEGWQCWHQTAFMDQLWNFCYGLPPQISCLPRLTRLYTLKTWWTSPFSSHPTTSVRTSATIPYKLPIAVCFIYKQTLLYTLTPPTYFTTQSYAHITSLLV